MITIERSPDLINMKFHKRACCESSGATKSAWMQKGNVAPQAARQETTDSHCGKIARFAWNQIRRILFVTGGVGWCAGVTAVSCKGLVSASAELLASRAVNDCGGT
jgi:hypothetical protein